MKKDFISAKKYFYVLMWTGLISTVFTIVSCNNDNDPSGTKSNEMIPLEIKEISISGNDTKSPNSNKKQSKTDYNSGCNTYSKTNYSDLKKSSAKSFYSSDSSICFLGDTTWNTNKKASPLRSADANLKKKGIGIFRLSGTGYPAAQNNIHYTYNNYENIWVPSDKNNPVYLSKNNATLCAYYPYNIASDNGNVILTSQLYSEDADICYQTGQTASSESGDVSFTLKHAYAKITFIFKREESYSGAGTVSKISISGENILSSNTFDIKTGTYGSGTHGTIIAEPGISSIPSGGTASTEMLLVPVVKLTDKITFTFTIDGTESMGVFSPSVDEFNKFEAGKNYTIKIDLTSNLVIVSGETANCYMISPGISIGIPVNAKGNGDANAVAGTGLDVYHTAASVGILWETSVNLITISNFNSSEQMATIVTNSLTETGNAVVAAYSGADQTGDILWSWHIWVTDYNPDSSIVQNGNIYTIANTNGSYTWMDRNLGATTITPATTSTLGLLYQWGRKDPFPGANNYYLPENNVYTSLPIYNENGTVLTEESGTSGTGIKHEPAVETTSDKTLNLKNSIKNPMMFYYGVYDKNIGYDWYTISIGESGNERKYQNDALWGGASNINPTDKTVFDPCPPGWSVPAWNGVTPWRAFTTSTFTWTTSTYGRTYNGKTFYPAAGYRHCGSGALCSIGSYGYDWSASISSAPQSSYNLYFYSGGIHVSDYHNRAGGFSVRCVKE